MLSYNLSSVETFLQALIYDSFMSGVHVDNDHAFIIFRNDESTGYLSYRPSQRLVDLIFCLYFFSDAR